MKKNTETAISENLSLLSSVLDSSSRSIVFLDRALSIRLGNKVSLQSLSQMTGAEFEVGKSIFDYFRPEDTAFFREAFDRVAKGITVNTEREMRSNTGRDFWIDITIVPVFDDHNEIIGVTYIAFDITEEKRQEEQIRLQTIAIERAKYTAAQMVVAAGFFHDLNNILTSIMNNAGYSQVLAEDLLARISSGPPEAPEKTSMVGDMEQIIIMLRALLDSTHSVAELTTRHRNLDRSGVLKLEAHSLEDIIDQAYMQAVSSVHAVPISIKSPQVPMQLMVDGVMLVNALSNLLVNAVHAVSNNIAQGVPESEMGVTLQYGTIDGDVVIEITDTGTGINEVVMKRIFEPYFTTKEGTHQKGTGLGMMMVQRTLEQLNGSIELRSVIHSHEDTSQTDSVCQVISRKGEIIETKTISKELYDQNPKRYKQGTTTIVRFPFQSP